MFVNLKKVFDDILARMTTYYKFTSDSADRILVGYNNSDVIVRLLSQKINYDSKTGVYVWNKVAHGS